MKKGKNKAGVKMKNRQSKVRSRLCGEISLTDVLAAHQKRQRQCMNKGRLFSAIFTTAECACIRARTHSREKNSLCIWRRIYIYTSCTVRESESKSVCKYVNGTHCARDVFVCSRDQISFHFRRAKCMCSCKRHTRPKVCMLSRAYIDRHKSVLCVERE
jgi:hypothetical protein